MRFQDSRSGNAGIIFALCLVPLVALAGGATDFTRASTAESTLQSLSDQAALSAAIAGPKESMEPYVTLARQNAAETSVTGVTVSAEWISDSDVRVRLDGTMASAFLQAVPGAPKAMTLSTVSVARRAEPKYRWKLPKVAQLDPEAGDYNELSVYCFDSNGRDRPDKGRTQMVVFADNGGKNKYNLKEEDWPQCGNGQYLSFKLRNVRDARTNESKQKDKKAEQYEYFTDTILKEGAEQYDLGGYSIFETVLCDKSSECVPKSAGGVIPTGKNRTPQRNNKPCHDGGVMYYGWEDRPPGRGSTDKDYDDIRVMIDCPKVEQITAQNVWLIH